MKTKKAQPKISKIKKKKKTKHYIYTCVKKQGEQDGGGVGGHGEHLSMDALGIYL